MRANLIPLICLLALSAQPASDAAEEGIAELNRIRLELDIARAEAAKPLAELGELYRARLESLQADAQATGRLSEVIAVRAELARLDGQEPQQEGEDFEALAEARAIYLEAKAQRERQSQQSLLPHLAAHLAQLEAMKVAFTRVGEIDLAMRVQEELDHSARLAEEARTAAGELQGTAGETMQARGAGAARSTSGGGLRHLKVRVQVDGSSHLHLQGHKIWFDHTRGHAHPPGRHRGEFPTTLNDTTEWMPVWDERVTDRFDAGIDLSEDGSPLRVNVRLSRGRGKVTVVQQPSEENDYTAIVEMRHETRDGRGIPGSDWMEFRLTW